MSVTFTFYTVAERKPPHKEEIIWLKRTGGALEGFEPRQVSVSYYWDDNDGGGACYNGEDSVEGHELKILLDGWHTSDDDLWASVDEYWAALDSIGA